MPLSSLQSQYAERSDAILLVVIPASQAPEVASAKAIRIAKELDGECGFAISIFLFMNGERKKKEDIFY